MLGLDKTIIICVIILQLVILQQNFIEVKIKKIDIILFPTFSSIYNE